MKTLKCKIIYPERGRRVKKLILSTVLISGLLIATTNGYAQQKPMPAHPNKKAQMQKKRQQIDAMRIGFISKRIHLTPEQAEKFWPVFNQHEADRKKLRENFKGEMKPKGKTLDQMTDAEIQKMLNDKMEMKTQLLALDKSYLSKYESVISIKQVAELYKANIDFKMFLLKKLKEHHNGNNPHHPPHPPMH